MSIKSTIVTRHAKLFDFRDPRPEAVSIADMCESLSKLCRFTGHCYGFYSVAAHSIFVGNILVEALQRPDLKLEGLLHEGNEPYMNDVNSPLKGECPDYKAIQKRVENVVAERFGLRNDDETHRVVKRADWLAYCVEQAVLMPKEAFMVDALAGRAPTLDWCPQWAEDFVIGYAQRGDWKLDRSDYALAIRNAMGERL